VTITWDELVASALRNQKGAEAPTHCDAPPDTCFTWTVDYAIEQCRVILLEKTQQSLGNLKKKVQEETCSELPEKCLNKYN
jgi:hypothetical protein